jgi:hypothetical protein
MHPDKSFSTAERVCNIINSGGKSYVSLPDLSHELSGVDLKVTTKDPLNYPVDCLAQAHVYPSVGPFEGIARRRSCELDWPARGQPRHQRLRLARLGRVGRKPHPHLVKWCGSTRLRWACGYGGNDDGRRAWKCGGETVPIWRGDTG